MEKLYLFEVLVDSVTLEGGAFSSVPPDDFVCSTIFGDLATVDIASETVKDEYERTEAEKTVVVPFGSGKSYLFSSKPEALLEAIVKHPLDFQLAVKSSGAEVGVATLDWDIAFSRMVSESAEATTKPASRREKLMLRAHEELTATADVFVRMSCFGTSIQTQFHVVPAAGGEGKRQYLFKSTATPATFQLQK